MIEIVYTNRFVCCHCGINSVRLYEYYCTTYCECMALIEEAELSV